MKLLFDQNISPRLVGSLRELFPDSSHVYLPGLERAVDVAVWEYARDHDFAICTRDADFDELATIRGFPPKVV